MIGTGPGYAGSLVFPQPVAGGRRGDSPGYRWSPSSAQELNGGVTEPDLPREPAEAARVRWLVWYGLMNKAEHAAVRCVEVTGIPAWRRRTPGEPRWPVTLSVIAAIVLQFVLPDQLRLLPRYVMPALETALLIGLIAANPVRIERRSQAVRWASIVLIFLITLANIASTVQLLRIILEGKASNAVALLASGAAIWATNVIAFGLWYWEFDRGGPVHRAHGTFQFTDLMFPQMTDPQLAAPDWEPQFVDYLYLSFTNATAFSPTDVMPLARWAKLTMLLQSAVSLVLGVLVVARAVNILR
jgi:uncharacterized membrane protein